jgi:hypothetical protein
MIGPVDLCQDVGRSHLRLAELVRKSGRPLAAPPSWLATEHHSFDLRRAQAATGLAVGDVDLLMRAPLPLVDPHGLESQLACLRSGKRRVSWPMRAARSAPRVSSTSHDGPTTRYDLRPAVALGYAGNRASVWRTFFGPSTIKRSMWSGISGIVSGLYQAPVQVPTCCSTHGAETTRHRRIE